MMHTLEEFNSESNRHLLQVNC
uniref:Uncharacterized protein n=1 Tax=Arundo donax TaxID=35708 RepID=A0A0A9C7D1_ARUDO